MTKIEPNMYFCGTITHGLVYAAENIIKEYGGRVKIKSASKGLNVVGIFPEDLTYLKRQQIQIALNNDGIYPI